MVKLADLVNRGDFTAGPLRVSPATRVVEGPSGRMHVEPIVMKVLLLLLDARGDVVSRDKLFASAWGGVFVGDDSLHRAIGRIRKITAETAPGFFEIDTIPRTGYRITGKILEHFHASALSGQAVAQPAISRRLLIGAGSVTAVVAGAGLWRAVGPERDDHFDELMAQGRDALQKSKITPTTRSLFEHAVQLRPNSARAWGSLALVRSFQTDHIRKPKEVDGAESDARRALSLDPNEPNALLALLELQGSSLDWLTRDQTLRHIITIDPQNIPAITELFALLQAAGLNGEALRWNEHAISIEPLAADLLSRRALKLWIAQRTFDADKVIDQVRDLYPDDPFPFWVRFLILALTDRAAAAKTLMDGNPTLLGPPPVQSFWRKCLPALEVRSPNNVANARQACVEGARRSEALAAHAVMLLSVLSDVNGAFSVSEGFLMWRGTVVPSGPSEAKHVGPDASWRVGTQWLFTPPCAIMRSDPRFLSLCNGIGLDEYWHKRGVRPDYERI
jgi:DNA-binding winged helix-turn-helix (wHTH) protein/tetratricopeptide (TPR) repeat protein